MAFKKMMGRVQEQQDKLAYDKLRLYLQAIEARCEMHDRIEKARSQRELALNTRRGERARSQLLFTTTGV